jgi:hypothetical protein
MVPETFKRLYKRYNHNITSWESKNEIAIANRVAKSPVPDNIPESNLFLPASAWYLSSAEGVAFAQRVWMECARGGKAVWSPAVSKISSRLPCAVVSLVCTVVSSYLHHQPILPPMSSHSSPMKYQCFKADSIMNE